MSKVFLSSSMLWRQPYFQEACPICRLDDGFHDHRDLVEVPRKLLKEKGWEKKVAHPYRDRCNPEQGSALEPAQGLHSAMSTIKSQKAKWYRDRKRAVMNGYHEGMDSEQLVMICRLFRTILEMELVAALVKEANRG